MSGAGWVCDAPEGLRVEATRLDYARQMRALVGLFSLASHFPLTIPRFAGQG